MTETSGKTLVKVFQEHPAPSPPSLTPPHFDLPLGNGIYLTPTGATIEGTITFDEFCNGLKECQRIANGAMWTLGDLLLYGEGRGDWGEMYSQALDLTRKSYSTLTQAVYVSKRYAKEDRVDSVSWSHHREAAKLSDPQERRLVLERAAAEGWSREDVRAYITEHPPQITHMQTTCPSCGHQW
jgi:hypothetical protein